MNNFDLCIKIIDFMGIIISSILSVINAYIEILISLPNKKEGDESKVSVEIINNFQQHIINTENIILIDKISIKKD